MNSQISGFALINKPAGMSSFQAVNIVKKKLKCRKAGHTGTLDPFAEGLLVVLFGDMTRFFDYFMSFEKTYTAEALFGEETDTEDVTGTVIETSAFIPDLTVVQENINKYKGEITQIPPVYSAVHVNGKRAYQLAREGIKTELKPRKAFIYSLEINSFENKLLNFTVSCSSGTYIRSIARDLARDCKSAAYLKTLIRTDIGNFNLEKAVSPEDFTVDNLMTPYEGIKIMDLNTCTVKDSFRNKIYNGITPDITSFESIPKEGPSAVFDTEKNFAAFIERNEDNFKYRFVIPERNRKI